MASILYTRRKCGLIVSKNWVTVHPGLIGNVKVFVVNTSLNVTGIPVSDILD